MTESSRGRIAVQPVTGRRSCGRWCRRIQPTPVRRQHFQCAPEWGEATRGHGAGRDRPTAMLLSGVGSLLHRCRPVVFALLRRWSPTDAVGRGRGLGGLRWGRVPTLGGWAAASSACSQVWPCAISHSIHGAEPIQAPPRPAHSPRTKQRIEHQVSYRPLTLWPAKSPRPPSAPTRPPSVNIVTGRATVARTDNTAAR